MVPYIVMEEMRCALCYNISYQNVFYVFFIFTVVFEALFYSNAFISLNLKAKEKIDIAYFSHDNVELHEI